MSGNVGSHNLYEDGDQKTYSNEEIEQAKKENRYHEGKIHSHKALDAKDERSIANKLSRESKRENEPEPMKEEDMLSQKNPTLPAKMHGNEPSKGAKIDEQIRQEEEEMLKKKDAKGK